MLRWRLLLSVPLIALLAGLCWLDAHAVRPGAYLTPVALVMALACVDELLRIFAARGRQLSRRAIQFAAVLPVAFSCVPLAWVEYSGMLAINRDGWLSLGLIAGLGVVLGAEMSRFGKVKDPTINAALGTLAVLYVGGLTGMLVQMRLMPGGLTALLSLIAIVKLSDIGQYFTGRAWGRRRLAPGLSPSKTWEGLGGGIAMAVVGVLLLTPWLGPVTVSRLACGVAFAVAGVAGDLAESLLKRDADVKDSSSWLPGFGGVLDIVDSILAAGPVAYFCWAMGWME